MKVARNILAIGVVTTTIVWIVTEWRGVVWTNTKITRAVWIGQGVFQVIYDPGIVLAITRSNNGTGFCIEETRPFTWFAGFEVDENAVNVPLWAIVAGLAVPWFLLDRAYRKRRRAEHAGCCTQCGYDLTGNESGVCSECGCEALPESKMQP